MKRAVLAFTVLPIAIGWLNSPDFCSGAVINLPANAALPTNTVSNPGFIVRTVQASTNFMVANNMLRAIQQLDGTLTDASNNATTNVAEPGPEAGGAYFRETVSFERDAAFVEVLDENQATVAAFAADFFPGIPGMEGEFTGFATEAIGLVELPAGLTMLGISASAERTDVNDDDGYAVFVGANPRDFSAIKILEFTRGSAQPFAGNQHIENQVLVNAPVAGAYPFRIVYWQTGRGANLQFYTIDTNSTERILINDPIITRSPRAWRSSTDPRFNAPYVSQISPVPGSAGVSSSDPIEVILFNGSGSTIDTNSVQLTLNNTPVAATTTRSGSMVTVGFAPNPNRTDANNQLRLTFQDSAGTNRMYEWAFQITTSGGSATPITGQWNFDAGDLSATVGTDLAYLNPSFDGPTGTSPNKTQFGTASSFGLPLINGEDAAVVQVPGDLDRRIGYVMTHGIAPNGGGTRVNVYTLIMDVYVDDTGPGAAALLQTSSLDNTDDGDLFWQGGNFGQGENGYIGKGTFTAGAWHRVVAAYDMAATPPVVTKYVDGIKQHDWTANQSLDNPRRALQPTAILFGDGDQDERRMLWVNSIQIRAGKLSDAEMVLLGGPTAAGIPAQIPQSTAVGQWDFDFGDLSATIGNDLQYLNPTFDGPAGSSANKTEFGLASELGVDLIDGVDSQIMKVPGDLDRRIGYVMTHGIPPNGGGTRVNQYTLIMDVWVDTTGPGAAALLQTSSLDNTDDGDLFWQGDNFGQGENGYLGQGTFTAGAWHRVAAAYDMGANPPVVTKYVDGIFQDDWTANQSLDHPRRSLQPTAVLFGDGDQDERRAMWVNSIQIRAGALSKPELEALGGPSAAGIPVALAVGAPPATTISRNGDQLTISWPESVTGYVLESTPSLTSPAWTTVANVANNSVTVTIGATNTFFRLKQ